MKRREFLTTAAAAAATLPFRNADAASGQGRGDGMRVASRAKAYLYGCAVSTRNLAQDSRLSEAVAENADILVHERDLKRNVVQPAPNRYDFTAADYIFRYAERNAQKVRGHTLVWYHSNPDWLPRALDEATSTRSREDILTSYIKTVVGRYAGRVHSWDVVNEAVEPADWRRDGMRSSSVWFQAFGEDYISLAFHAARDADGGVPLFLNDFGIENDVRWNEQRRTAVLNLLDRLLAKGVPMDGFGIQGHLKPYQDKFNEKIFDDFLLKLKGYGLRILITELDVADKGGPADPFARDSEIAAVTKSFMDVALANSAVDGVLTWGISDRYSWLSLEPKYKWPDGQFARGLPLDSEFSKKPMWDAMALAFQNASGPKLPR